MLQYEVSLNSMIHLIQLVLVLDRELFVHARPSFTHTPNGQHGPSIKTFAHHARTRARDSFRLLPVLVHGCS